MKLLLVEDEIEMSDALVDILTFHKYIVDACYDGREALEYIHSGDYDGIILDIMLPGLSGLEVLRNIRREGNDTPVLMLTARSELEDRIAGLDSGADDYLPKPFDTGELLARIRAILRRRKEYTPSVLKYGNITLNMNNYELSSGDGSVVLPKLEYQLMELFMINKGIYLSTDTIFEKVWGLDTDSEIGVVWVYISYLRKRLDFVGANVKIQAKRNIGYRLEVQT